MKVPVTNNTAMPIYVGAAMIPPGETRHFDVQDVPMHLRPVVEEVAEKDPADPMDDLLAHKVADIVAQMPNLSDEDLGRLGEMEQAKGDKARKSLLEAISEETLKRAE